MNKRLLTVLILGSGCIETAQTIEEQITAALTTAPPSLKDGATVITRDEQGEPTIIRQGTNSLICEGDNPFQAGYNSDCYHRTFQPVKDMQARSAATGAEFTRPKGLASSPGSIRYSLHGETQEEAEMFITIGLPYATEDSTGLSVAERTDGSPWLMWPGTPATHIMFSGLPDGAPLEYPFKDE